LALRAIADAVPAEKRHYLIGWEIKGVDKEFWSGDVAEAAKAQ
jgi:hypothetical protein